MGDLDELRRLVEGFIRERDWDQFHSAGNLASAISIESAELLEVFLWKSEEEIEALMSDPISKEQVESEVADIMIYLISLTSRYGIDLPEAVRKKVASNAERYPVEAVKGKALKYTEL